MSALKERQTYHALASLLCGEYRMLARAHEAAGSWEKAWTAAVQNGTVPASFDLEAAWQKLIAAHITLLLPDDPVFPKLLREIPGPPLALYLKGAPFPEGELCIALVGTRRASPPGAATAQAFARTLAERGVTVVSGLAFGIDAAAHRGAIAARRRTIAVVASGLDVVYPRAHRGLAAELLTHGGALVSEYPPGSPSFPHRFIERNRLVSGLSRGVVVIEAPEESGALSTARFALDQNREVFVVPGPVNHPNYRGSHALIRSGAALVTTPAEVLEEIPEALVMARGSGDGSSPSVLPASLDNDARIILNVLEQEGRPLDVDTIAERTAFAAAMIQSRLSLLLCEGLVAERGGKYFLP